MSRARDWDHPETGEKHWFDVHGMATDRELELLAEVEDLDIDDLLDANLSSREVLYRLNKHSELIPPEGLHKLERRQKRREEAQTPPVCQICSVEGWKCQGTMTRHHFMPRWMMLELLEYTKYAPRSTCTMWLCFGSHRFLHLRHQGGESKSIVKYLTNEQKRLLHHLIDSLKKERPALYNLIASGDKTSYEWQLIHDWRRGAFDV